MRFMTITCVALLTAAPLSAQDEPARKIVTEQMARVPLERALTGLPYSAETLVEASQQLADGNRIARKTTGRVYRDTEGRTRREEDRPNGTAAISITDPVAGFSYSLDAENKVAWRTPMGAAGAIMSKMVEAQAVTAQRVYENRVYEEKLNAAGQPAVGFVSTPLSDEDKQKIEAATAAKAARVAGAGDAQSRAAAVEQEKVAAAAGRGGARGGGGGAGGVMMPRTRGGMEGPLEHKTLEGVPVEGRKTTTVIPAGQVGNEQPITITSEEWRSAELNVLVMTRYFDPRTGESTYRLQNIVRAEPDRSLFMVPPDYTVKDTGIRRLEASRK